MLRIETRPAILAWETHQGRLDMQGNGHKPLQLSIQKPALEIQTQPSRLQIDQRDAMAEVGLKMPDRLMQDYVRYSKQKLMEGISRRVDQGNQMKDIHTGVDPIPDQAIYNAFTQFEKSFGFGMIPLSKPRIQFDPAQVNIQYREGQVQNHTTVQKVEMTYVPYRMDFYMQQYHEVNIQYEPSERSWVG